MNVNPVSDSEVISDVLAGNSRAYAVLISRYQHMVFTLAVRMLGNRELAEETTQDVFVKVYTSLETFRGESKFSTWLYRVAYHRILDASRRETRQTGDFISGGLDIRSLGTNESTWDCLMTKERRDILVSVLAQLSTEENSIISLYYLQEMSVKEISEIINLGQSAVKVRLFRAREHLRSLLVGTTQGALLKTYI